MSNVNYIKFILYRSMNEYRSLPAAAVVHGKIFCCGGSNGCNFLKSAECYDPSSDIWTLISDMPGPNGACGIVVMDAHLIVIGGKTNVDKDFLDSVWALDATDKNMKWIEQQPSMPLALCHYSIAKIDGKIFVCGGADMDCAGYEVEIFDGDVWRNGPALPSSRVRAPAVVIPMEFAKKLVNGNIVVAADLNGLSICYNFS